MRLEGQQTGIRKLPNGRYRARYFAGYDAKGRRVYPARTFDTQTAALKWRSERVAKKIAANDKSRSMAEQYSQGAVYSAPFAIPDGLRPVRKEILEIHLPLARICCVYFLLSPADEVLYVGQTTDLHQRLRAHSLNGVQFQRALFIPVQAPDLCTTEAYFIRTLNPTLNRSPGRSIDSEPTVKIQELIEQERCA